jgi:hypothetical protein
MKTVTPPRSQRDTLVITVNPLQVPRGRQTMPRGGKHGSGKHPSRAKARQQWRRQIEAGRRWVS